MKKNILQMSFFIVAVVLFSSCDIDDLVDDISNVGSMPEATENITKNTSAQMSVIDVFENVNNYAISNGSKGQGVFVAGSPVLTVVSLTQFELDYSDVPNASGKLIIKFSGLPFYITPNLGAEVSFDNYINEGVSVEGKLNLLLVSFVGVPEFTLKSDGYLSINDNGDEYEWMCDESITWLNGSASLMDYSDDEFGIDGWAKMSKNNVDNKLEVTETLVYAASCEYLKDGIVKVINKFGTEDAFDVTVDFGVGAEGSSTDGECDGYIEVKLGTIKSVINLDN